ncbi:MAG: AAA family ATPase [Rhodobacteraceae bacterium]|nr:AAA family ATPase [Paracoccaceae bacterium]
MTTLHIPQLNIERFRGIRKLQLTNLGRVTLLTGKNSIGKTTILEAIQLFNSRGDDQSYYNLLMNREELVQAIDEDGDEFQCPDYSALFHEYLPNEEDSLTPKISIDAGREEDKISLELVDAEDDQLKGQYFDLNAPIKALEIKCGEFKRSRVIGEMKNGKPYISIGSGFGQRRKKNETWPEPISYQYLAPGMLSNNIIAKLWDGVVLTPEEDFALKALRLIVGEKLEQIAIVGGGFDRSREFPITRYARSERKVVAKLKNLYYPIPLKRLGDGAQRLLGISLALANCQNGILLIDEVENGIHCSLQVELWRMIFNASKKGNVQVIAATHSWDCIAGFTKAANESDEDGSLVRLERIGEELLDVSYSEKELDVITKQRIEVR